MLTPKVKVLRDNRKEEFKEVLFAMSKLVIDHMTFVASQGSTLPQSEQAYLDSMKETYVVLCDRIYINGDLERDTETIPRDQGAFSRIRNRFRQSCR